MPSLQKITTIGFDADDTLWQNETFYRLTQDHVMGLLADYADRTDLDRRLIEAERRNIEHYGYGVKGFTLSLIETAIEVTEGRVPTSVITEIMDVGRDLLAHPLELLPHARATVEALSPHHRLVLITKGDLLHQERKLAQSGLGDLFHGVEIVSEKTPEIYQRSFARHGSGPEQALMVGNSVKSDVIPAIQAGSWGVLVPHGEPWELERAETPDGHPRFRQLDHLGDLPALIAGITE